MKRVNEAVILDMLNKDILVPGKYVVTEIEEGIQYNYVEASLVEFQ